MGQREYSSTRYKYKYRQTSVQYWSMRYQVPVVCTYCVNQKKQKNRLPVPVLVLVQDYEHRMRIVIYSYDIYVTSLTSVNILMRQPWHDFLKAVREQCENIDASASASQPLFLGSLVSSFLSNQYKFLRQRGRTRIE